MYFHISNINFNRNLTLKTFEIDSITARVIIFNIIHYLKTSYMKIKQEQSNAGTHQLCERIQMLLKNKTPMKTVRIIPLNLEP